MKEKQNCLDGKITPRINAIGTEEVTKVIESTLCLKKT